MFKIFLYECKRLLCNKFIFGILLILLFYSWQVLSNITILGVSYTAPFSAWSFGDYLSRMIPLLWIEALFFLTFFLSPRARRVAILTNATQASPCWYAMARCAAALVGIGLLALVCFAEAAVFYAGYFEWYECGNLLLPALVTLTPPLVFTLGSGWLLGQIKTWLLYVWMIIPFVCMALPLPEVLGLWNGSFFTEYPLTLGTFDPAFSMPVSIILVQCVLFVCGIILLLYRFRKNKVADKN